MAVKVKHAIDPLLVTAGHPFYAIRDVPMEQANDRTLALARQGQGQGRVGRGRRSCSAGDYVAQVIPTEVVHVRRAHAKTTRASTASFWATAICPRTACEWGVSGNPRKDEHLAFVRAYLDERGIHFWETGRGENYGAGPLGLRPRRACATATTGRIVGAGARHDALRLRRPLRRSGSKRIARRFAHLPRPHTLALIRGLLETDGGVSRGKEIYFTNTSKPLDRRPALPAAAPRRADGRPVPRARERPHEATRSDGSTATLRGRDQGLRPAHPGGSGSRRARRLQADHQEELARNRRQALLARDRRSRPSRPSPSSTT